MSDKVEVTTELKVDDSGSAAVLKNLQAGFADLQKDVRDSQSLASSFGKQFTATFAAINVQPAIRQVREWAKDMFMLGDAADDSENKMAAMLRAATGNSWSLLGQQAKAGKIAVDGVLDSLNDSGWRQAKVYTESINEELTTLAINSGIAKASLAAGHAAIAQYMGGDSKAFMIANDNIESLSTISDGLGISMEELSSQFGKMAQGVVQMQGPVFQLLRNTGIFDGNLAMVNEKWKKLTEPERIQKLEQAFKNIANNVGETTPTLSDMLTSVHAIGEEFMETFGKSAIKEFMGGLQGLKGDLGDARGDLRAFAADTGKELGQFVGDVVKQVREGLAYVKEHGDEIKAAVKEGFQFARDTITWIIGHKGELMAIGGAFALSKTGIGGAMMGGVAKGAMGFVAGGAGAVSSAIGTAQVAKSMGGAAAGFGAGMAKDAAEVTTMTGRFGRSMTDFVKSGDGATQMGARLAGSLGGLFSSIAAGGPAVWAATAAIAGLAAGAIYLNNKMDEAEDNRNKVIDSNVDEFTRITNKMGTLTEKELARLDELRSEAEKMAGDKLISERVGEKFESAWQKRSKDILEAYVHPMEKIQEAVDRMGAVETDDVTGERGESGGFVEEMNATRQGIQAAIRLYEQAAATHNQGAMDYIGKMIGGSEAMRNAFLTSGEMTTEGFMSFAGTIRGLGASFSSEFGQQVENIGKAQMELTAEKAGATVNMNGGQVFKIEQNFRDQDPDRVAIAFREEFTGAAVRRVQATTSTAFGT